MNDLGSRRLRDNPEPQSDVLVDVLSGWIAQARGRDEEAADHFRHGRGLLSDYGATMPAAASADLARLLVRTRGTAAAREAILDFTGEVSPASAAYGTLIRGLVEDDPRAAVSSLRDAAGRFEAIGMRVELARTLLDLGRAQQRIGEDPRSTFERARDLLVECGAHQYVPEAEELLASASSPR
jgi:hypothetical protein